jgi:hypothetical protein
VSFSYSGNPATSDTDSVRFLLGDTESSDPLLQNEEIEFLLEQWSGNLYSAAAAGAEQIAAQVTRETPYSGDGVDTNTDILQQKFMLLASQLRMLARRKGYAAAIYAGGIDRSDVEDADADDTAIAGQFGVGMHDHIRLAGAEGNVVAAGLVPLHPPWDESGPP